MLRYSGIYQVSLIQFTSRILQGGGIAVSRLFLLLVYFLKLILGLPPALLQQMLYRRAIRNTAITKDPVFIIGHFRSGTTLLQKLLISDTRFGYMENMDILFPGSGLLMGNGIKRLLQSVINWLKLKNAFYNNTIIELDEPTEEDYVLIGNASAYTSYWGFIFPARWKEWLIHDQQFNNRLYRKAWEKHYLNTLKMITCKRGGKQLVLKNPPNTARIPYLLSLFPNATFIYIRRNPYDVFISMRNLWKNGVLRQFCLQQPSQQVIDEIIFSYYAWLEDSYQRDKHLIPAGNLAEVFYDNLEQDPFGVISKLYAQLRLPDFSVTAANLKAQLQKEKAYTKFSYSVNDATLQQIDTRWEKYIRQWKCAHTSRLT